MADHEGQLVVLDLGQTRLQPSLAARHTYRLCVVNTWQVTRGGSIPRAIPTQPAIRDYSATYNVLPEKLRIREEPACRQKLQVSTTCEHVG